jgi:hypothetical protein
MKSRKFFYTETEGVSFQLFINYQPVPNISAAFYSSHSGK